MNKQVITETGYQIVPVQRLMESPHNPRRRFNEKALGELSDSIFEHGILTPLLGRPSGGLIELAAGHRRLRAAHLAGLSEVPVIVREMTDKQLLEILTIENLQREDVHAYEEAQGYAELLKMPGYNVEALAGKIGRSESYVHSRLKLTKLIPEVVDAFLEDRITFAHARLIAPLPDEKQAEALQECFEGWGEKKLLPPSDLRQWIRDEQGESLSDAPFDLEDIGLLPEAGPCMACPKSTCAEGKLFADDRGEETCYDKACFELKIEAQVRLHTKAGLVAIDNTWDGKKAPAGALLRAEFTEIHVRNEPADDATDQDEDDELDPDQQACKFMEDAVVVSEHGKGSTITICRNPKCPIHGKAKAEAASASRSANSQTDWHEQREADERKKKAAWAKRREMYDTIIEKWAPAIDRPVLFLLVVSLLDHVHHKELLGGIAEALGVTVAKEDSTEDRRAIIYTWAEKAGVLDLRAAFIRLFFVEHIEREEYDRNYDMLQIASDTLKQEFTGKTPAAAKPTKKKAK